ncbi:hypothetical protein J6590_065015 [Homalodisca vitripennis]|nr:hypothetical protein J6590_065015 [Homalodisca vitripennis]
MHRYDALSSVGFGWASVKPITQLADIIPLHMPVGRLPATYSKTPLSVCLEHARLNTFCIQIDVTCVPGVLPLPCYHSCEVSDNNVAEAQLVTQLARCRQVCSCGRLCQVSHSKEKEDIAKIIHSSQRFGMLARDSL